MCAQGPQPFNVNNSEDGERRRGLLLSTFMPSKPSQPVKSISLFFNFFMCDVEITM